LAIGEVDRGDVVWFDRIDLIEGSVLKMLRAAYRSSLGALPEGLANRIRRTVGSAHILLNTVTIGNAQRPSAPASSEKTEIDPGEDIIRNRIAFAERYYRHVAPEIARWAHDSRENDNFTYDLTDQNLRYLASLVSAVTKKPIAEIEFFLREPQSDLTDLPAQAANLPIDNPTSFGRRLGWYAIARATKPRLLIETGIRHGLGSVLLCSALRRNAAEGAPGRYIGTDIDPYAGVLLTSPLDRYGKIMYGDSIVSLQKITDPIDLFINDSDHSSDYESREYLAIKGKLSDRAIVLGDNSHSTDALLRFSIETGRNFVFFKEEPKAHWYPGAGIGISYPVP
jgi:hypothetical protein